MGGRRIVALATAACVWVSAAGDPRPAAADDTALPAWLREVTLNGLIETSYSWNANRPDSRTNQLRVFDVDDATFRLDEFELVVQRAVTRPRDTGFRVDMTFGPVSRVTASTGLFRDTSGVAGDLDVHQAFVSVVAPLGAGVRIDAGKFVTPVGAEVVDGYDGWNGNATRSLLFGYAIPFTHVGIRASTALTSRVAAMLMVVNGWDVARDNNRAKTVGGQVTVTPGPGGMIALAGIWGPEQTGNDADARSLIDLVASCSAGSHLTLALNADWGQERVGGLTERWNGAAGYLRLGFHPAFALWARAETFDDPLGVRTGVIGTIESYTVTPEWKIGRSAILRADLRYDHADQPVFEKGSGFAHEQPTVMAQALYSF